MPVGTDTQTSTDTTDTTTTTAQPTNLADFIGEKGELKEGWKDNFLPEDLRSAKVYEKTKDLPSAFRQLATLDKLVGKKGVIIPTEADGESVWEAYRDAIGVPKTYQEYNYEPPADIELVDYSPEAMAPFLDKLHKLDLRPNQFNGVVELHNEIIRGIENDIEKFNEQEYIEADNALRQKWGTAYDENLHLVNRMITENVTDADHQEWLIDEYGNNPQFAEFLHNIAKKFIQHRIITNIETPSAATDDKIAELMGTNLPPEQRAKLPYWDGNHPDHKKIVDLVQSYMVQQAKRRQTETAV